MFNGMSDKVKKHPLAVYLPVLLLLLLDLVAGTPLVTDYGESWDEHLRYAYAQNSLNAYRGIPGDTRDGKGPFFGMLALIAGRGFQALHRGWLPSDARHYVTFLSFLLGIFFLYRLSLRFVGTWAAFGVALLFNTQPLLWGHAFINPKDIPFLAFFLVAVEVGLRMADSAAVRPVVDEAFPAGKQIWTHLCREWGEIAPARRRGLLAGGALGMSIALLFTLFGPAVYAKIEETVHLAYAGEAPRFWGDAFARLAQNRESVPAEAYVQKAWKLYRMAGEAGLVLMSAAWGLLALWWLPRSRRALGADLLAPFWRAFSSALRRPSVLLAGVLLGCVSAIRIIGTAAGGLVALYLLLKDKNRRTATAVVTAYALIGVVVMYALWPGMWGRFWQQVEHSLFITSNFPWEGKVLFRGMEYSSGDLPRSFVPVLLGLQLTPTLLLPAICGLGAALLLIFRKRRGWEALAVLSLWFWLPLLYIVIARPKIYDNFRHFLFILPPIFVWAALGIQALFRRLRRPAGRAALLLALVLPNLWSLIRLHPYQYVYYNALTGGVAGAFRKYELDYWATSYRRDAEYLNRTLPPNAVVIVWGAPHLVSTYARDDLNILKYEKFMPLDFEEPVYAVLLSRHSKDLYLFPEAEVIYTVQRDGAVLSVVTALSH